MDTDSIPAKGDIGYDGYKKVKGSKISILMDISASVIMPPVTVLLYGFP